MTIFTALIIAAVGCGIACVGYIIGVMREAEFDISNVGSEE